MKPEKTNEKKKTKKAKEKPGVEKIAIRVEFGRDEDGIPAFKLNENKSSTPKSKSSTSKTKSKPEFLKSSETVPFKTICPLKESTNTIQTPGNKWIHFKPFPSENLRCLILYFLPEKIRKEILPEELRVFYTVSGQTNDAFKLYAKEKEQGKKQMAQIKNLKLIIKNYSSQKKTLNKSLTEVIKEKEGLVEDIHRLHEEIRRLKQRLSLV